ncbi:MAG: DUF4097 family beta strand repeat-containing protein [Firmicutes bacterium]|nr:DUF4097 family beta strand repeat-containing protein [Bacillota bacterium]
MKEERLKILEMLEKGKITAEDAEKLLGHLPTDQKQRQSVYIYDDYDNNNYDNYNIPRGGILDTIVDALSNLNPHTPALHKNFEMPNLQQIKLLELVGKNGKVSVEQGDDNVIKIHCKYAPKRGNDIDLEFSADNGEYRLNYDKSAVRFMHIDCEVPSVLLEKLHVQTSNAGVDIEEITCNVLEAYSSNASINIEEVVAKNIVAETSNASVNFDDVKAETAKISTSNSKINVDDVDILRLSMSTSNGSISLDGLENGQSSESRVIKGSTSNGGISIKLPVGLAVKLSADTSHGTVKCNLADNPLQSATNGGNPRVSGENNLYQQNGIGLELKLSTSNGNITIYED